MTLRILLASLITVVLIAGFPAGAQAGSASSECATVSSVSIDGGCCGAVDKAICSIACPAPLAAAVGEVSHRFQPTLGGSPLERSASRARFLARPPDTAPPKSLSA